MTPLFSSMTTSRNRPGVTAALCIAVALVMALTDKTAAFAAPQLQSHSIVDQNIITLGDVFAGLEKGQNVWVADAPIPGRHVTLPVKYIAAITRRHGIAWRNHQGLRHIRVERDGYIVPRTALKNMVHTQLQNDGRPGNFQVSLHQNNIHLYLLPGQSETDVTLTRLDQRRNGLFKATFSAPSGKSGSLQHITLSGQVTEVVSIPALKTMKAPGETITRADVVWITIPKARMSHSIIRQQGNLIGQTPRRPLQARTALRDSDVQPPVLVRKGSNVTMTIQAPGMMLSTIGRALQNGGMGDVIKLLNSTSHQTVMAQVTGLNEVRVLSHKPQLMAYTQ
ncbi:MAG: flagella basal body P-ring formation protein FlgA [Kordiimonas sp.]|nr:flagella basal body P-ring formation protein FlgA [Kordiimonas sp.]